MINSLPDSLRRFDDLPRSALVQLQTVSALLGVSRVTIHRMRKSGRIPEPVRLSPKLYGWRVGDLRDFLDRIGGA